VDCPLPVDRDAAWNTLFVLVPYVGALIISVWLAWQVPRFHRRSAWWTVALVVPIVNVLGYWAYALTLPVVPTATSLAPTV
jgi:hypothetical protein